MPPPAWRNLPTNGSVDVLAVLIEFGDTKHASSAATVTDKLYGDGDAAEEPYESLHDYYARSSYGQLNIQGDVLGWYDTGEPRPADPKSENGRTKVREDLIEEALRSYDGATDFSRYDNNGDGVIDYLMVVWAGPDNDWGNLWWGYNTDFENRALKLDGIRVGNYSWMMEQYPTYPGPFSALVAIHETGHALGLPDYYDYESKEAGDNAGPDGGVGGYDMMDQNMCDHNAFSKFMLDWIKPKYLTGDQSTVTLQALAEAPDALVCMADSDAGPYKEFFIAEYRRRVGNDTQMPTDGLLIWHVDARLDFRGYDFLYDNSWTKHKLLRLMEADGLEEIESSGEQRKIGNPGDFYTVGDTFGPDTKPDSDLYDGSPSSVSVGSISAATDRITFTASSAGGSIGGGETAAPAVAPIAGDEANVQAPVAQEDAGGGSNVAVMVGIIAAAVLAVVAVVALVMYRRGGAAGKT